MATIDELLASLGVEDSRMAKQASVGSNSQTFDEIEKAIQELGLISDSGRESTTKTASQRNGGHMDLHDLYNVQFGSEQVKTASFEKDAAAELEAAGEAAGRVFARGLENRLYKFAAEMVADSAATQDIQSGAGIIPSAAVANPQIPVNRPEDADEAMDTTPEYYDLLSKAVEKKVLESALAEGEAGDLSHQVVQVDSGMETPTSQMNA